MSTRHADTHGAGTSTVLSENFNPYFHLSQPWGHGPRWCGSEDGFQRTWLRSSCFTTEVWTRHGGAGAQHLFAVTALLRLASRVRHLSKTLRRSKYAWSCMGMWCWGAWFISAARVQDPKGTQIKPPTRLIFPSSKMMKKESNLSFSVILWSIIHYLCFKFVSNVCH